LAIALVLVLLGCDHPKRQPSAPNLTAPAPSGSASAPAPSDADWPTYHHDNGRSGVAPRLSPVGTLAKAWEATLDGAVYGQPLVLGDRVLAATENASVYGLAASDGHVLWSAHIGAPMQRSKLPCGNIDPLGITSTMAYDAATGQVFALAELTGAQHVLVGIDAATGAVRLRREVEPPKGDRIAHQQRSALTVHSGRVYIGYGGLAGDCGQYIGSVVSVPTTGDGAATSYAIPTTREGGIWAPGGGTEFNGRLLYSVGNGESTDTFDGSDSVIALSPELRRLDFYAPSVWAEDNARDLDLGSMTPAVVGSHVLIIGKRGIGYVLDGNHLGQIGGEVSQAPVCQAYGGAAVDGDSVYVPCTDGAHKVTVDAAGHLTVGWHSSVRARGSPVVGGGQVWVEDYLGGTLYTLDPATGAVRQKLGTGVAPHFASPTLSGNHAYVGTMTGVFAAGW
jgi:outer membrane protein assembly factor BamB